MTKWLYHFITKGPIWVIWPFRRTNGNPGDICLWPYQVCGKISTGKSVGGSRREKTRRKGESHGERERAKKGQFIEVTYNFKCYKRLKLELL